MAVVAVFDPVTAAVTVSVEPADWPGTVPASVSVVRRPAGAGNAPVRGWTRNRVVGGLVHAVDTEMPLGTSVVYTVTGWDVAGVSVGVVSATASTAGAEDGLWIKAPGRPDLTMRIDPAQLGDITSDTIGGNYQILGGDALAVSQWGGVTPTRFPITLRTERGAETAALRRLLSVARVVLLQPVGLIDIPVGWYYVSTTAQSNPGGFDAFDFRHTHLQVESTSVPAGDVAGATWTWEMLAGSYATWDDVLGIYPSWAAVVRGPA